MSVIAVAKRVVPRPVRRVLRRALTLPEAVQGWLIVSRARRPANRRVRVFYGYRAIPALDQHTHGGIVKCQHMQAVFPNSPRCFNVLYLVSSRIPSGVLEMARIARRKAVALVWNQNGVAYPAWHGPGWQQTNAPMARLLRMADHVFYQSRFCKRSADRYLGTREGRWEVLPNPVDTRLFSPAGGSAPAGLVLLLGGNQFEHHRLELALRVLSRLVAQRPDARLLVTGRLGWTRGSSARALAAAEQLAGRFGVADQVAFLGPYTQREAPALYRRAHVLLHTKYHDPCPGVVLEAMACGLPVVYADSGGVRELVGEEAGIGVPVELSWERVSLPDPEAMARAVLEVWERRESFAQAARQRAVEQFDLQRWLRRHQEVFEGLCR
jgi:glycosyltransferase involved in cell wall biosynthesis